MVSKNSFLRIETAETHAIGSAMCSIYLLDTGLLGNNHKDMCVIFDNISSRLMRLPRIIFFQQKSASKAWENDDVYLSRKIIATV